MRLPLLEPHRAALETCVYCPKLCRAACPVSNVEHAETVTPWGKMSLAYFAARGDVPTDREHADPAWACTGCFGCREHCDHKNEVAPALMTARAEAFSRGAAPPSAARSAEGFARRSEKLARAVDEMEGTPRDAQSPALLVGCSYFHRAPDVARDALYAVEALGGSKRRLVRSCCGLSLLHAGDREGFTRAANALAREVARAPSIVVVDAGCAHALSVEYPRIGVKLPPVDLFVDLAARKKSMLPRVESASERVRWHDPCQLGRGMNRYDEPRDVLAQVTGQAPLEFRRARGDAECSGGGGLLPVTRPETARGIARARVLDHRAEGGGVIVTGCAESLHRFRDAGEAAIDLASVVARALRR